MIGQKQYSPQSGGIENHVCRVASQLAQKGHQLLVYSRNGHKSRKQPLSENIKIKPLPFINTKHLATPSLVFIATLNALTQKADIIHYHGIGPAFFAWIPRLLKPSSKIIVTVHCRDYYHQKWGIFARTFLKLGETIGVISAHKVTTVSPFLKKYLEKKYHCLVTYIPNGAQIPEKIDSDILNQWSIKPKQYILTVNRLIRHKNIHVLIKAFKKLKYLDKKLVIVGGACFTKGYQNYLKKLAQDDDRITFAGTQNKKNLTALYQNCWLFVQPSREEGLSTSLLEALACGSLVLASDITANRFLVEKTGFSFKAGDKQDLVRQIKKIALLSPAKAKSKKEKAQALVAEKFDWGIIAKKTVKLYQAALSKKQTKLHFEQSRQKS